MYMYIYREILNRPKVLLNQLTHPNIMKTKMTSRLQKFEVTLASNLENIKEINTSNQFSIGIKIVECFGPI